MALETSINEAHAYKMGGPRGALFFTLFFTLYTYFIAIKCQTGKWDLQQIPWLPCAVLELWDLKILLGVLVWFLFQCVLYLMPFGGPLEQGTKLPSGKQLQYRMNAFFVLCVNMAFLAAAIACGYDVIQLNGCLIQILTSAVTLCCIFSIYLYIRGASANLEKRNRNGNTGIFVYDWFMGRELNPRWGSLDVKYVFFRSGIIGWILLNFCNVLEYWQTYYTINPSLLFLALAQCFYVLDYFWFEGGILVSRDIVHEGLGYNILVQFLMIPFCFSVQTRYVLTTNHNTGSLACIFLAMMYGLGYYIYRASNAEKNNFRKNPNDKSLSYLKSMPTASGRRLLISGWWGICRHPNYMGDIIMSLSYSMCTGFGHLIPYLGTLFLVLLLLDREKQDSDDCKKKYGNDWDIYCGIVKYRLIPYIY